MMMIKRKEQAALPGIDEQIEPIDESPRYAAALAELRQLEQVLDRKLAERTRLLEILRTRGSGQRVSTLSAEELAAGAEESGATLQGQIDAREREANSLRRLICDKSEELRLLKGDLSYDVCQQLRQANVANHRAVLTALATLSKQLEAALLLHQRVREAGYAVNESVMPLSPVVWNFFRAGHDPLHQGGAIGRLQQFIEEQLS